MKLYDTLTDLLAEHARLEANRLLQSAVSSGAPLPDGRVLVSWSETVSVVDLASLQARPTQLS